MPNEAKRPWNRWPVVRARALTKAVNRRLCILPLVSLGAVVLCVGPAMAREVPKEGAFDVTNSTFGTFKGNPVGQGLFLAQWDETGPSVGTGLLDQFVWRCFGVQETINGVSENPRAYCIGTDTDGDQIGYVMHGEKHPWDATVFGGTGAALAGTGKYVGIASRLRRLAVRHGRSGQAPHEGRRLAEVIAAGRPKLPSRLLGSLRSWPCFGARSLGQRPNAGP